MLPYLQIGPIRIWTYGLMLACGLWTGYQFLRSEVDRRRLPINAGWLMFWVGLAGILGAKAYHILVTRILTEHSAVDWRDVISPAGLAWGGGLIAGFATLVYYAKLNRISIWLLLDAASPAAAVGYALGRLGCFLSGDGDYGIPTNLPWGMSFPHGLVPTTERVHPTPLYEIAASLLLLLVLRRIAKTKAMPGMVFAVYLVGSGMFRFLVEFIRRNPPVFIGLTEAQWVAAVSLLLGVALLLVIGKREQSSAHGTAGL
jgi:phosphatidylglycerol---prolipoprotein diacylglyceryl transferase